MNYLPKLGNIKIGGTSNGLPVQFSEIFVTKTSKKDELFELMEDFPKGEKSIQIILPFITHLESNFEVGLISFILINNDMKYLAKDIRGEVYLFPLQPNFANPTKSLPVIKLGETELWASKLGMKESGLLYAYVPKKDSLTDYVGGGSGVFLFKTESAHTMSEINNTMSLIKSIRDNKNINVNYLRFVALTFEICTKIFEVGDIKEVTYARLLPPTPMALGNAIDIEQNKFNYLSQMLASIEKNISDSREESIKNSIDIEAANKFFGKKITFKQDTSEALEVSATPRESTIAPDMQIKAEELSKDFGLPLPIMIALVKKAGSDSVKIIEQYKTVEGLIKYIGQKNENIEDSINQIKSPLSGIDTKMFDKKEASEYEKIKDNSSQEMKLNVNGNTVTHEQKVLPEFEQETIKPKRGRPSSKS